MQGRLPDFVIIGAMKCGTTALARHVAEHPDVFVAREKEVHYFDMQFEKGDDWYASRFAAAGDAKAVGEATPAYMYDPAAFARLADRLPSAKLVAILRNPIDRAYSQYWHNILRGEESLPFSEALAAEPERLAKQGLATGRRWAYADRGRYAVQLERVLKRYPRESVLVLRYEDLRRNPQATCSALFRHIGVREDFVPPSIGSSIHYGRRAWFPALSRLTARWPWPLPSAVQWLNARRGYPAMDAATRVMLVEKFRPENAALSKLLGQDFSSWDD
jgi:hypothetical protein